MRSFTACRPGLGTRWRRAFVGAINSQDDDTAGRTWGRLPSRPHVPSSGEAAQQTRSSACPLEPITAAPSVSTAPQLLR